MKEMYQLSLITSVALLCFAASGCGDSDTNTSSTNDTEQRDIDENSNTQYSPEFFNDADNGLGNNRYSKSLFNGQLNNRPVADISGTHTFISGETVTLDGSGSYDKDSNELRYFWWQSVGPRIDLNNNDDNTLTFVAPEVSEPTQLVFHLFVNDGFSTARADFSLQVSPVTEDMPPSITNRYPQADQTDVPTTAEISVTFNEALLESSIDTNSLTLSTHGILIPGNVSYDDVSHSIVFSPNNYLTEGTQYTISLGEGIQDISGNMVNPESWEFKTIKTDDGKDDNIDDGKDDSAYNLGPTTQETINSCMDDADKQMLTLVNNTRAKTRSCASMSYPAAPALAWNCKLENAAQSHSSSMAENNYFDHTGLDGSSPGDRISAAGYNWKTYGENIAAGYQDAQSVMQSWLTSSGHCANIMNANFKEVGVGMVNSSDSYGTYWTQVFAAQ
jgi:uncharacterized protein YkwD